MPEVIFIMAASHSGSTLLAFLLGSHSEATTIGDTGGTPYKLDPNYLCSCGRLSRKCPFWLRVADEMSSRGFEFDVGDFGTHFRMPKGRLLNRVLGAEHRGRLLEAVRDGILWLSPGWKAQFRNVAKRYVALVEVATAISGARILADSSKRPNRLKFLLRIPELRVKVVHLVRDGRGVAHTYMQNNGWSPEKSFFEWRRGIRAAENLLSRLDRSQWTQVRYENLCADPIGVLERLCDFVGLDPVGINLDFRSAGLHVFGNKMRLASEKEIRLDETWKSELSERTLARFDSLAGELNRRYGYS